MAVLALGLLGGQLAAGYFGATAAFMGIKAAGWGFMASSRIGRPLFEHAPVTMPEAINTEQEHEPDDHLGHA